MSDARGLKGLTRFKKPWHTDIYSEQSDASAGVRRYQPPPRNLMSYLDEHQYIVSETDGPFGVMPLGGNVIPPPGRRRGTAPEDESRLGEHPLLKRSPQRN